MDKHLEISVCFDEYNADKTARKSLTVNDLIEILSDLEPDQRVVLSDYSGYTPCYAAVLVEKMTDHSQDDEGEDGDED